MRLILPVGVDWDDAMTVIHKLGRPDCCFVRWGLFCAADKMSLMPIITSGVARTSISSERFMTGWIPGSPNENRRTGAPGLLTQLLGRFRAPAPTMRPDVREFLAQKQGKGIAAHLWLNLPFLLHYYTGGEFRLPLLPCHDAQVDSFQGPFDSIVDMGQRNLPANGPHSTNT